VTTVSPTKRQKALLWTFFFVSIGFFLYMISGILLPFIAGILVAYLLNPLATRIEFFKIPRALITILLILMFFAAIGSVLFFAIPLLKKELLILAEHLPDYGERIYQTLFPIIQKVSQYIEIKDLSHLKETAKSYLGDMLSWGLKLVAGLLTNSLALANLLSLVILTPVVAFYLLRDWPHIIEILNHLLPREHAKTIRQQVNLINKTLAGYIRGQATVCLILATLYSIGFLLTGLDFAITIGFVTGCLAFIPYFGFLIGAMAAFGVAFAQFDSWTSIGTVGLVLLIGQLLEGNVLTPKLVGDRIGLHPVWIIFSLLAGGVLFGFWGLLVAMPIAATLGVLVRFIIDQYLKSPYYKGLSSKSKIK
jgi:predicted PurR-regulated permease PerM